MVKKTIVVWGAGRIGRGFIADLFHEAGYHITLVDKSTQLIAQLRQAGRYTVVRARGPGQQSESTIAGYTALATDQTDEIAAAIISADIASVAVFPQAFAELAQHLVPALLRRRAERLDTYLDIILCTNLPHAGPQFQALLLQASPPEAREYIASHIGIVEAVVMRIVTDPPLDLQRRDPLLVWTDGYPELPVDRHAFRAALPQVRGLRLADDMRAEEARKMYTLNMAQAALAYWGAHRGYQRIVECMADPAIRTELEGAFDEVSHALQAEYGFPADEMRCWIESVARQINNPLLGDTVKRLGADLLRKLKRDDRLVGPALLARKHSIEPRHLVRAIAAGLHFENPDDPGTWHVQQRIEQVGVQSAVREICELTAVEQDLVEAIVRAFNSQIRTKPIDNSPKRG